MINLYKKIRCWIGWHAPFHLLISTGFDGCSSHCKCPWCGYEGMIDSQGNLF